MVGGSKWDQLALGASSLLLLQPTASNSPPPWSNNPSRFTVIGFKSYLAQDDFGWVTSSKRHLSFSLQCDLPSIFRSPMCVTNPQTSSLQVTTYIIVVTWNFPSRCTGCPRKNALSERYRASSGQKPSVVIMIGISECARGSVGPFLSRGRSVAFWKCVFSGTPCRFVDA